MFLALAIGFVSGAFLCGWFTSIIYRIASVVLLLLGLYLIRMYSKTEGLMDRFW